MACKGPLISTDRRARKPQCTAPTKLEGARGSRLRAHTTVTMATDITAFTPARFPRSKTQLLKWSNPARAHSCRALQMPSTIPREEEVMAASIPRLSSEKPSPSIPGTEQPAHLCTVAALEPIAGILAPSKSLLTATFNLSGRIQDLLIDQIRKITRRTSGRSRKQGDPSLGTLRLMCSQGPILQATSRSKITSTIQTQAIICTIKMATGRRRIEGAQPTTIQGQRIRSLTTTTQLLPRTFLKQWPRNTSKNSRSFKITRKC